MPMTIVRPSEQQYNAAFDTESAVKYQVIDSLEKDYGYAIDIDKMLNAARVLACPVKVNPPNWQHGRVIYSATRRFLSMKNSQIPVTLLDIGTAKGFSALCLRWALTDSCRKGSVTSVDVIDPNSRVMRNTIADVSGPKTLHEVLEPWPEAKSIRFVCSTGVSWLNETQGRIHFAFVDGKHNFASVSMEAQLLSRRQDQGDIVIFDDLQIPGVAEAVRKTKSYEMRIVSLLHSNRQYAICTRK